MKRALFAVLFAFVALPAAAQDPSQYDPQTWFAPGCPLCGVTAYVDLPAPSVTVSRADLLARNAAVEGWGFERVSGAPVDRVDVYLEVAENQWRPIVQAASSLEPGSYRPDVRDAYARYFPAVSDLTGWVLYITNWPDWALGAHRVQFVIWHGPYHTAVIRTYNVTP